MMFELPRYVIKSGEVLVEEGEIRQELFGDTHHVSPEYDPGIERHIADWFDNNYSVRFRNYPVDESYLK
jgi:formylmethanofuran dehydrogenase subunit A